MKRRWIFHGRITILGQPYYCWHLDRFGGLQVVQIPVDTFWSRP